MTGPRHSTDETGERGSDMPNSYGPSPMALAIKEKANIVSREDGANGSGSMMWHEPKPGQELNFN